VIPFWLNDTPRVPGAYLCAWAKGDGYVYAVGWWDGGWTTKLAADPEYYQEIKGPQDAWDDLENLYQHAQ
jgi:hypothetical protein